MSDVAFGDKPRVRVRSDGMMTMDSFQNFIANLGIGTGNLTDGNVYGFNPITRNRLQLEWMYRGSWLIAKAVDAVAEDMTREGVEIQCSFPPDMMDALYNTVSDLAIWNGISSTIKWSRLYGGAICAMLIDGQDPATPLRPETIGPNQFKGLLPLDRWLVQPSLSEPVDDYGPELGMPKWYDTVVDYPAMPKVRFHHSRCLRLDGMELPFWQRIAENGWGLSVVEPMLDRLTAFDSATTGAAQLIHKAHLRTIKIPGFKKLVAAGGAAMSGVMMQLSQIRMLQTIEGLTVIDGDDEFDTHTYTFAGLSDMLIQFGQQISGATGIPLTRLFGQSPAGMNATGESDTRNYYDSIKALQEARLRRYLTRLFDVMARSSLGEPLPPGWLFKFVPLWQTTETERADIATKVTTAVVAAFDAGIIGRKVALQELKQTSHVTGLFSNITDEQIDDAEDDPPAPSEAMMPGAEDPGFEKPGDKVPSEAEAATEANRAEQETESPGENLEP